MDYGKMNYKYINLKCLNNKLPEILVFFIVVPVSLEN